VDKVKPVKAWGVMSKTGVLLGYAYRHRDILLANWTGVRIVRVEIRVIPPKRRKKGRK